MIEILSNLVNLRKDRRNIFEYSYLDNFISQADFDEIIKKLERI